MIRAVVMILEKNEKILFAKRSKFKKSLPNKWSLPSGKLEENEEPFEGAKREIKEELGIEIFDLELYDKQEIKKEGEEKILYFIKANYKDEPRIVDETEMSEIREYSFEDFFNLYEDKDIGHGLQYLRTKITF